MIHWQVTFASYLGKTYTVSIYDDSYSGDVVSLTPAAEPFYTEDDADSDILTPMRTQTGYLRVIAQNDLTDLYPTTPTSRPVIVRDENSDIVWHGYIGCESYSQPWDATPYELELPLVSSIGVLQFLEVTKDEMTERAHIAKYIKSAITKSGGNFTTLVFPTTFTLDSWSNDVFLRLGIQERNWFKYVNENMYDKTYPRFEGMTWYQVLQAICEAFGLTLYERGTTLYMIPRGEDRGQYSVAVSELDAYDDGDVPYDAEVEYLEATGTQYIDTGIYGNINVDFEINFQVVGTTRYQAPLGDKDDAGAYGVTTDRTSSTAAAYAACGSTSLRIPRSYRTTDPVTYTKSGLTIYVGESEIGDLTSETYTTSNTLILFGRRDNGTLAQPLTGRIFSCKFYNNGTLVRDFVPVRVGTVGAMYDRVSGRVFSNSGTGDFTYGSDVTVVSSSTATPTPVYSNDVLISSLTIAGNNGQVSTSMPASRVVVESEVNPIDDDAFPIVSTAYLQDSGSIHVTRYYNNDPTGYYYDADLEYYTPTTEGENYWTFASCFNGSETTWDIQDLNRDYSMAVYVRTSSKSDGIFFTRNTLGMGTPDAYFKLKSKYATTFMGGQIKISGTLEADEGDGAGADHCMWMQVKIGDYYYSLGTWLTNPISPRFVVDFNSSSQQIAESIDSNDGLTIQLPTNSGIYGVVEVTCWSPRPKYEQSPGSEGAYLLKNFKLSYEMPEGSIFGDHPVTDTNRFAMDLNTFGEEKTINPILSSYINWRFGYAVLFKPDYSAPVEKVDIGQSQSHEGEDEVYLEKRLLWAMQYYYSTAQREITFPIRTSTIYSPLTFFVDSGSKSHYLLAQSTNWRDDEQTIKIFDNLQSSAPSTYRVTVSGNVNEAGTSSVAAGGSLSLTLTTAENYSLDSATVTMGGMDITASAYSNGVVTIASVTGNVVITAATTKLYDAEVEYLEGSGTQWIDTGIYGTINIDFEVRYQTSNTTRYQTVLGDALSSSADIYSFVLDQTSSSYAAYLTCGASSNVVRPPKRYRSTNVTVYRKEGLNLYYWSTLVDSLSTASFTTPNTLILFGRRVNGEFLSPFLGKIYYCKLYNGDTLVRDFIPVRVGTVGYMYDRVSGQLFGNAGSGSFTYGSDV